MKKVKILDCSLRDGGRIIDCAFPDTHIKGICKGLVNANIDIVELGFLRGNVDYRHDSTYFTQIDQIKQFIPENHGRTEFVVFTDYGKQYGMWDFSRITPCDGSSVTGIRVGYRKNDLRNAIDTFHIVNENGYKLFIQGVESLNYSDREMLEAIEIINKVKPYSFGIVDTYGSMYKEDVLRLFQLVDRNLDENIAIDFHSHNNMQLSFSFAQEIIECNNDKRTLVIDATLEGMGKGTGNLNTELILDYLCRKRFYNYDLDALLDVIDEYITGIKSEYSWAYTIPAFMAGIYSSHANNISYLTGKHMLSTKDIKNILSMMSSEERKRYDYDKLEALFTKYTSRRYDDRNTIQALQERFSERAVLLLAPGPSIIKERGKIEAYIAQNDPIVISVNFLYKDVPGSYAFFGNQRRYKRYEEEFTDDHVIVTSNISDADKDLFIIDYESLVDRSVKYYNNSSVMLLKLLNRLRVKKVFIAGIDGFTNKDNYFESGYDNFHAKSDYKRLNDDTAYLLKQYAKSIDDTMKIEFITESVFSGIFNS